MMHYWLIKEWFNKTTQRDSKVSTGYAGLWFNKDKEYFMNNPDYTEIYEGTRYQTMSLVTLRDGFSDKPEWKEQEKKKILSQMERIK